MSRVLSNAINQITRKYNCFFHKGVDLVKYNKKIAPVIAHSDGVVVEVVKKQAHDLKLKGVSSYGNYIKLRHDNGMYTLYAHLGKTFVNINDHVRRGDIIGRMGNTGNAKEYYLHFEVRNKWNFRINPTKFLDKDLPNNAEPIEVIYQVYDGKKKKWLPNVINDSDYAGSLGNPIQAINISLNSSDILYRVHEKNNKWLSSVSNSDDYAGSIGKNIDGIQIASPDVNIAYRVHLMDLGWLPWIYKWDDTNEGYAGVFGYVIDAVQIKVISR